MVNLTISLEEAALIDRALVHLRGILVFNANAINSAVLEKMDASRDIIVLDNLRTMTTSTNGG